MTFKVYVADDIQKVLNQNGFPCSSTISFQNVEDIYKTIKILRILESSVPKYQIKRFHSFCAQLMNTIGPEAYKE